jgi:signal transduction histidine kinase
VNALEVISVVLAVVWAIVAATSARLGGPRQGVVVTCWLLAVAQVAAAAWEPMAPVVLAAWFGYALTLPLGRPESTPRRVVLAAVAIVCIGWAALLVAEDRPVDTMAYVLGAVALGVLGVVAVATRCRHVSAEQRRTLQWLVAAGVLAASWAVICATLHVVIDSPRPLLPWVAISLVLIPVGHLASLLAPGGRAPAAALIESMGVFGVATLVAVAYLVFVAGINGRPAGHERGVLIASLVAAIVVAVLAVPVRDRLTGWADRLIGGRARSTEEVVTTFGARMSRAVPMDEPLLQLVESLRGSVAGAGAEIWTGTQGVLNRAVSLPERGPDRLHLDERERVVIGQTRTGGPGWATVWLPALLPDGGGDVRFVPIAHLGELLGLIVLRRRPEDAPFTEEDERPLVDVARQLGLALNNVRLDSALQASLAELAERNEELQASRLRIVTAADTSRRMIERNLHDGAQQHLVALAVKLNLAEQITSEGDSQTVAKLLAELRGDVQTTIGELRELAHGIYPPLLRERGLGEALRTVAVRSTLPCTVDVELPGRYAEEVETAAYFCCLEAIQNTGKYAGDDATLHVQVRSDVGGLCLELVDDGKGFDMTSTPAGHGFLNMQDRLGAIGGDVVVESAPGAGTTVRISIPADPLPGPAVVGPAVVGPAVVGPAVVGPAVVGPAVVGPAVVGGR